MPQFDKTSRLRAAGFDAQHPPPQKKRPGRYQPRWGSRGIGARVSVEQEDNWGMSKPVTPSRAPDLTPTGIEYDQRERDGLAHGAKLSPFVEAGEFPALFGRFNRQKLIDIIKTNDGFGWVWWAATKADISHPGFAKALQIIITDPRSAAAVKLQQERDAKRFRSA